MPLRSRPSRLRVGVIGYGAIGRPVVDALRAESVAGCELAGVLTRSSSCPRRLKTISELTAVSDIIVEAGSHEALATYGPEVCTRGIDLLIVSVGALTDSTLLTALQQEGAGRVLISTGAIGGLDVLRAAKRMGPVREVSLESTKPPELLVQPWMSMSLMKRLQGSDGPVEAFRGTAREAARLFPNSANVSATLGLATIGLDNTQVRLVGDNGTDKVRHVISAVCSSGNYEISIENQPSPLNPRTSAITPYSVIRALEDLCADIVYAV